MTNPVLPLKTRQLKSDVRLNSKTTVVNFDFVCFVIELYKIRSLHMENKPLAHFFNKTLNFNLKIKILKVISFTLSFSLSGENRLYRHFSANRLSSTAPFLYQELSLRQRKKRHNLQNDTHHRSTIHKNTTHNKAT